MIDKNFEENKGNSFFQTDFLKQVDFLDTPLEKILGKKSSEKLEKIGPKTLHELLKLSPRKYYKKGELTNFTDLEEGKYVTVQAKVVSVNLKSMHSRKGHILQVLITDGQDYLTATFFAKNPRMLYVHKTNLKIGENVLFSGTISSYNGIKQLVHPEFETLESVQYLNTNITNKDENGFELNLREYVNKPIPIYPATNGFASWKIKASINTVLDMVDEKTFEKIVPEIIGNNKIYSYYEAIQKLHNPNTESEYKKAIYTLKYYEAIMLNISLKNIKNRLKSEKTLVCENVNTISVKKLLERLPYELTNAQKRVISEIDMDITKQYPMQRMILGDVGSGKTIVALLSMLKVVDNGYQAVMLAPTEVLATQHYESICDLLGEDLKTILDPIYINNSENDKKIDVNLLTASNALASKKEILAKLASGMPGIFIGTHALLSDTVAVNNIALIVIDEQHRFGVEQRQKLIEKSSHVPHVLSMSATPIPRSLAVTIFGDTDISIIDEKPKGRMEIQTFLMNPDKTYIKNGEQKTWEDRLWEKAAEEIKMGNCIYVVVPKISGNENTEKLEGNNFSDNNFDNKVNEKNMIYNSEKNFRKTGNISEVMSIDDAYKKIKSSKALQNIEIHTLSSNTSSADKEKIITDFAKGQVPILISTTVIEVGVDVKNATMIVIMDAHRFGLATLHQLRGRVGRNDKQSYCMLLTDLNEEHPSYMKLEEFAKTNDGFKIAELDLSIRKEGDILGAKQSGRKSTLKYLNVIKDNEIIRESLANIEANEKYYMQISKNDYFDKQIKIFFNTDEEEYWFKS